MIGAQTGRWYYFDGRDWVRGDPPSIEIDKVKCYTCGLENDPGTEFCERCGESLKEKEPACPRCGSPLEGPFQKCPRCSQEAEAAPFPLAEELIFKRRGQENFLLRHLHPLSVLFLSGGAGLFLGVIGGAFLGASEFFSSFGRALPDFVGMLQGTLMGGIVFAFFGGVIGFAILGVCGYLWAQVFNVIASIMGGVRITLEEKEEKEEKREKGD